MTLIPGVTLSPGGRDTKFPIQPGVPLDFYGNPLGALPSNLLPVFNVKVYGAKGDGVTDDTAAIQAAATAAADAILVFPAGGTYLFSGAIATAADLTILAYGATLKWTGNTTDTGFYNTAAINLRWYGGTVDYNSIDSSTAVAFGDANVGAGALLSCVAEDLTFTNVVHGAWECVNTSNKHIRWRNVGVLKTGAGDNADMLEVCGADVNVQVWGVPNGTGAYLITSAYLQHATIDAYVCNTAGNPTDENAVLLQSFTNTGFSAPWFVDCTVTCNGVAGLANGNVLAPTVVSTGIVFILRNAAAANLGTSVNDVWDSVTLRGSIRPPNGGSIAVMAVNQVVLDLFYDFSRINLLQFALIYLLSNAVVADFVVKNLEAVGPASVATGIFNAAAGAAATTFTLVGGDVRRANLATNPLFASASVKAQYGTVFLSPALAGYQNFDAGVIGGDATLTGGGANTDIINTAPLSPGTWDIEATCEVTFAAAAAQFLEFTLLANTATCTFSGPHAATISSSTNTGYTDTVVIRARAVVTVAGTIKFNCQNNNALAATARASSPFLAAAATGYVAQRVA